VCASLHVVHCCAVQARLCAYNSRWSQRHGGAGYTLFTAVPFRLGYARITHGGLSDTEVQVGRFRIPHDVSSFADNEHITTDPQHVDKDVWFNSRWDGMLVGFALCSLHSAYFGCVIL